MSLLAPSLAAANPNLEIFDAPVKRAGSITIVGGKTDAVITVDTNDFAAVQLAAIFFTDDVQRVTSHRIVLTNSPVGASQSIIAGTLGHNSFIDTLADSGKLKDVEKIKGRWEATLLQIVARPFPGVERALVIAGSDRRGTAYGLMQLSEKIGVSPWYWWADVPVKHRDSLAVKISAPLVFAPAVKYRGIFINDEDWGLNPWASKTFDPQFGNIGPKTYEKVFELMLRLRLNYLWPAMHPCSREFGSVPENAALADKFGIVAGSSHCEPMLCNNVHWNEKTKGPWNFSLNRDTIHSYWEENAKARGADEAVWTLGIRGIHDQAMEKPPTELPDRINLVSEVIQDQRALLDQYVTKQWGQVAQCFVPYKEVLPIYDAGLQVPDDVTLVWVDDNFGYIRRLSAPAERKRSGSAGVYWHLSYYGGPHSYTWINTTAPALMWEELHKAWENDARNLWVINVGDIKPMEIGIDYFSRLAWDPDEFNFGAQRKFLQDLAAKNFGGKFAKPMADLLMEFYRLGSMHKPELMDRAWAMSLPPERAAQLENDYLAMLKRDETLARSLPAGDRDAYTEMIGFPACVLADAGLIFMADRKAQLGIAAAENKNNVISLRTNLEMQVELFNKNIAGGKWNRMMPGLETGKNLMAWNSQVRWPWGEKPPTNAVQNSAATAGFDLLARDATLMSNHSQDKNVGWRVVEGLGPSNHALALEPTALKFAWELDDTNAPTLEYKFKSKSSDAKALIDFLPTFRIYPGMKQRVAVSVDDGSPTSIEVPGSSGGENENGTIRSSAVQNNYVRAIVPLPGIGAGKHILKIRATDPGVVIDRVSLQ